jgi:hypothetical protein
MLRWPEPHENPGVRRVRPYETLSPPNNKPQWVGPVAVPVEVSSHFLTFGAPGRGFVLCV